MGGLVGGAVGNAFSTMGNNLLRPGVALTQGLGQNIGSSVAGAGAGIAANYLGRGISSAFNNSRIGNGIGAGTASIVGTVGGSALGNIAKGNAAFQGIKTIKAARDVAKAGTDAAKAAKAAASVGKTVDTIGKAAKMAKMNIAGVAGAAVGAGLEAAFGKSHAYGGKYGKITQGMDMAYDMIQSGVGFVPGVGTLISGAMALNKGLVNAFGSTDGMTKVDAIMASPLNPLGFIGNWINMSGAKTTGTFGN